jgi:DcuC family C4-dicarboxylate transporter
MNLPGVTGGFAISTRGVVGFFAAIVFVAALAAGFGLPGAPAPASRSWVVIAIASVDLVVVAALVSRGVDARMLLLLGALPLFGLTGQLREMVKKIVSEMANSGTVIPICSAMGFAFVLRLTACDQHLVRLMTQPLRRIRALLIPGGILAGYSINTTIVSQSGTAAVLGPVLIPVLRAGGIGPISAGAILLLGSSMGGELFNPGAVEMRKLSELTGVSSAQVVARSARFNLLACTTALGAFWVLIRGRKENPAGPPESPVADTESALRERERISLKKAMVPLLPIMLLTLDTVFGPFAFDSSTEAPAKILAVMLIGIAAAGLTSLPVAGQITSAFFEGAGYAYTHVISLIVAASTFAEGIRLSGMIEVVIKALVAWPGAAMIVATAAPWSLAFVAGTGIAPAIAIMEFFVPVAGTLGIDPIRLGTLSAMGAHFGRTMSPAAAVVIMSARLSDTNAWDLIRLVAGPLLAGGVVLLAVAMLDLL